MQTNGERGLGRPFFSFVCNINELHAIFDATRNEKASYGCGLAMEGTKLQRV
jgi:hypothetical protein